MSALGRKRPLAIAGRAMKRHSVPGLTRQEREMILCDNPAKLLKVAQA
jgi:hypothetical protein